MSWENYIAQVSANNINTEVGNSSTDTLSFNNSEVRNLAKSLGNETSMQLKNASFGLQLPLIEYDDELEDVLRLHVFAGTGSPGTSTATAQITIASNGSGSYFLNPRAGGSYTKNFTWLKIGSAGDYEVKLDINSGTNPTGASLGTWLSLSSNRLWKWEVSYEGPPAGIDTLNSTGVISIRKDSEVGPTRSFDVDLRAEVT